MAASPLKTGETVSEMEKLGAPKSITENHTDHSIDVLPMNWPVLLWFREVADLMRWRSEGQCSGLDLVQIKAEADLTNRDYSKAHFEGLRTLGLYYAQVLNKAK